MSPGESLRRPDQGHGQHRRQHQRAGDDGNESGHATGEKARVHPTGSASRRRRPPAPGPRFSPKRRSNKTAAPAKINKVNEWPKPQTTPWVGRSGEPTACPCKATTGPPRDQPPKHAAYRAKGPAEECWLRNEVSEVRATYYDRYVPPNKAF